MKPLFVNIYMIANRKGVADGWVLVDTGLRGYASKARMKCDDRRSHSSPPVRQWQAEIKNRFLTRFTFYPYFSVVAADDFEAQVQADAKT